MSPASLVLALVASAHPFTARDMQSLDRVADPQVSPDGKWVVFTVRSTDFDANKGRTDLWLVPAEGGPARQLTSSDAPDVDARWMPDGKSVVFLSARSGSMQAWRLAIDGGEAVPLTRLPVDVGMVRPFPDGKRFLLALEVYPDLPRDGALDATARRDADKEKRKVKARVYDELLYRHWDTWSEGKRSHLFAWTPGTPPVDLMHGMDTDCPIKPFGGPENVAISPDGKEVAFSAHVGGRDAAWSTNVDVHLVASDGSAAPRSITADNKATDTDPLYSPDGKSLLWLAMKRPGFESDRQRIMVRDRASGAAKEVAAAWDRSASEAAWSRDGKTLYVSADEMGNHPIFAIDVASGKATVLVDKGTNLGPRPAGARLVFSQDTLAGPADLYTVSAKGGDLRRLTTFNAERMKEIQMGTFEPFSFKGAKDDTVHGWLVRPVGFKEGVKVPVAVIAHGGPQGSMGNHFHYRWNPQVFAGAGYAVVFVDFHGSTGYGQAFTDAISKDWGGAPYEDVTKGLDAALQKYPFLDGNRACALGASYGGYLMNWIEGRTDRFKCLVNHDGGFDVRSHYYETEELWFPEWEFGGTPWEHPEGYAKFNPAENVAKWKTPMLVIHGSNDFRIPDTQGMQTFTALQRRGIPSRLVIFPDENHWVLKPQNSLAWYEQVLGWLDRWTKGN